MNNLKYYTEKTFEEIKHIDSEKNEYWEARELQIALGYKEWRYFQAVIEKAQIACVQSNNIINDHFGVYTKMVEIGSSTERNVIDYKLSRYACYLIVQNANPKYETVALGQTYFAVQTRKQEIIENYENLSEDEKRLYQRNLTRKGNLSLNRTARDSGVKNFDKFHNAGYKGLYNGETADDIAKRKGLRYREDVLDNMGSVELVDNLFRIIHTDEKLKKDHITGENNAIRTHFEVGKKVRETIKELGGTMPEDLSTPKKSIKELEKDRDKFLDINDKGV